VKVYILSLLWDMTYYKRGCWESEEDGIAEFCKYHDGLAAAEEMTFGE
jgi:hypothetical protein